MEILFYICLAVIAAFVGLLVWSWVEERNRKRSCETYELYRKGELFSAEHLKQQLKREFDEAKAGVLSASTAVLETYYKANGQEFDKAMRSLEDAVKEATTIAEKNK